MTDAAKIRDASRPPVVLASIGLAFRDSVAALCAMPGLVAATFAAIAVETLTLDALTPIVTGATAEFALLTAADLVIYAAIVTPLSVALYRFVATGERGVGALAGQGEALVDSFLALMLLYLPLTLPFVLLQIDLETGHFAVGAIGFGMILVAGVVAVKLTLLFPAIALRGPGASLRGAWRLSSGLFWRLAAILTAIVIPLSAPLMIYAVAYDAEGAGWSIPSAAVTTATLLLVSTFAARFYIWRAGSAEA